MQFFKATLILSGMIIGVGMFGIPFSFAASGFWFGIALLIALSGVMVLLHLLYTDIVIASGTTHRLPGYVRMYLGARASKVSWLSAVFGITGTLLAYILLGSIFLHNIALLFWSGSSPAVWSVAVVLVGAVITYFSPRNEASISGIFTVLLIALMLVLIIVLLPKMNTANFSGVRWSGAFAPYGVLLFSLSGGLAIPELITLLGRRTRRARAVVIAGTLLPTVLYGLFALAVVGAVGDGASADVVESLRSVTSSGIVLVGNVIGFLAVFTSFTILSIAAQSLLRLDFSMPEIPAWLTASLVPLTLYFIGLQDFILIISMVGAVAIGIDASLLLLMHRQLRIQQQTVSRWSSIWRFGLLAMMLFGVGYEIYLLVGRVL